jgi:predicted transcriptional regulator
MAEDKKTPKEASQLFHNIIKASVSPKATGAVEKKVKSRPKNITVLTIDAEIEIKVLELLKKSNGIHFTDANLEDLNYFAIAAIARDLEKKGFTSNTNGILDITENGKEYLIKLQNSNR